MKPERLLTGMIALDMGIVLPDQLAASVRSQVSSSDPTLLGQVLRKKDFLTPRQLDRVLAEQKRRMELASPDGLFGQLALAQGLITERQLGECLRDQIRTPLGERPRLGEVMMGKGYLDRRGFVRVAARQKKSVGHCLSCDRLEVRSPSSSSGPCGICGAPLRAVEDGLPLAHLSKFRILSEIARGSMGVVFKAYDSSLERTVALKVIKEGDADEDYIQRLHREGSIAARLRHPNIVPVYEVGESDGRHYLCMEYIPGAELLDHIRDRKLGRRKKLELFESICRTVHFAHAEGVIHRDLKPSNILVRPDGTPVLTDFGLAKSTKTHLGMTKEGTALGTPEYMPPEQVLGRIRQIDVRSDVYSLGAILYELLTGRPPFLARDPLELYRRILHERPVRPSGLDTSIEEGLESIVLKALEKERDRRYSSALDLALDLRRWLSGERVHALPIHPGIAALLGCALLLGVGSFLATSLLWNPREEGSAIVSGMERLVEEARERKP